MMKSKSCKHTYSSFILHICTAGMAEGPKICGTQIISGLFSSKHYRAKLKTIIIKKLTRKLHYFTVFEFKEVEIFSSNF
jgi:hypothetical protein